MRKKTVTPDPGNRTFLVYWKRPRKRSVTLPIRLEINDSGNRGLTVACRALLVFLLIVKRAVRQATVNRHFLTAVAADLKIC